MVGITAYSSYVPKLRLNRKKIFSAMGWFNAANYAYAKGEKTVGNHDEDSLTMSVAAGMDCLKVVDKNSVGALYLASTTMPYQERQNASIVAMALDLNSNTRTTDITGTTRAGTTALLNAFDAIDAGDAVNAMVCMGDCRQGKAGSIQEHLYGDGAAAFVVGKENVLASFEGSYSVTDDFVDRRRAAWEDFDHAWEERWIREEGYARNLIEAVSGLLRKYSLEIDVFSKVVFTCPYERVHLSIAKKMGVNAEKVQGNMFGVMGDTGAAYAPMMLVAALEEASPGDLILVAGYGSGCDAMFFKVTEDIEKVKMPASFKERLASKEELDNYEKYLVFRNMLPLEIGIRGEEVPITAFSALWRDRKTVLSLYGTKCRRCGTPHFPRQRVCVNPECGAMDEMEDYCFANRKGNIFTYTADNLSFSYSPPAIYGVIDFEGGGRYWFDFTDCDLESIKVGMPVEMSFRRKYLDKQRGTSGYFWKAVPVEDNAGGDV